MAILVRRDLQELARIRIREAAILLANGRNEGAYYLTGLSIECALKSCIARQTRRYEFPDKKRVESSYRHDLSELVKIAGIQVELDKAAKLDPIFERYWAVVKDWTVDSRYQKIAKQLATDIYKAASDREHGVVKWIRKYW